MPRLLRTFSASWLAVFILYCIGPPLQAEEPRYLKRSPRALFMGDAFTAIADDEYTLFYNPAGLGTHRGFSAAFLNPSAEITNLWSEQDKFDDFPEDDPVAIADRVMGIPFHLQMGATPSFKIDSFGLALMADVNTNMEMYNKTHPYLKIDYRYDRGFVTGFAFNMGSGKPPFQKRGRPLARSWLWSNGLGIKYLNREGLDKDFSLFSTSLLTTLENGVDNYHEFRTALGYSKGTAWGIDYGTLFTMTFNENTQLSVGASVLDIADTEFNREEGNVPLPTQEMMVNTGMAFKQDFGLFRYSFSFDMHPLLQDMELVRKTHVGAEVALPFVSVMGGFNGGYLSYGLGLYLGLFKLYGGFYTVERGVEKGDKAEDRALIYLSILDLSFDV